MKHFLIISILFAVPGVSASWSQTVKLDSLTARLQSVSEIDQVPVLINLIQITQQGQPQVALNYASEAKTLLEKYPDPVMQSQLQTQTGWVYYYMGQYDIADSLAKQAEQIAQSIPDPESIARSKLLNGRLMRQMGEFDDALAVLVSSNNR